MASNPNDTHRRPFGDNFVIAGDDGHWLSNHKINVVPIGSWYLNRERNRRSASKQKQAEENEVHSEKTISPPTTVNLTRVWRISRGGAVMISRESMMKSASLPGSSDPFVFSSNAAYAPVRVQLFRASSRVILWSANQPPGGEP